MPIRMVPASLLPNAVLRVRPALNARSVTTAPAMTNRFLIVPSLSWPRHAAVGFPPVDAKRNSFCIQTDAADALCVWLLGGPAPVDEDALPVDVAGSVGGEEDGDRCDVLHDADTSEGRP